MGISYRGWTILLIAVMLLFNSFLFLIIPEEILVTFLTAEGLLLDGFGAIIALTPDLTGISQRLEPTEKIERIKEAQNELFLNESIAQNDDYEGYEELIRFLASNSDADMDEYVPEEVTLRPHVQAPAGVGGGRQFVHILDSENGRDDEIGPALVMDRRVSDYIDSLRERGHQRGFYAGLLLLATGFLLQFVAVVYQNTYMLVNSLL
jgi:hypothetical protein